jgi:predicted anti-sigma-YlaC factor YlaD
MRFYKCQCSLFKDYYEGYLKNGVDEETKAWMTKHKEECSFCREWARSFEENREDIIVYKKANENKIHKKTKIVSIIKKAKVLIPLGMLTFVLAVVWAAGRLSS